MGKVEQLEKEIAAIQMRNKKVEADKAWETSWARKVVVFLLTYLVIVVFFLVADLPSPFFNAAIPAVAYMISSASLPYIKKWWIGKQ